MNAKVSAILTVKVIELCGSIHYLFLQVIYPRFIPGLGSSHSASLTHRTLIVSRDSENCLYHLMALQLELLHSEGVLKME